MNVEQRIPAAQYLRMSTGHQQYSLQNQSAAIQKYAESKGFEVVCTYSDAAKRGLVLKGRPALRKLLQDVVAGTASYRAVIVYDVSRWGRFQDTDESAHYEFLCKSAGVPVHYCAEQFANDNSVVSLILKALKRTMASEYSRELSVKVRAGQFRLAKLGYKMGGHTPFGLRRQLLDANGVRKHLLAYGERKSIANDRVILVPGPGKDVAIVERIFREFADEHKGLTAIARNLNGEGIPFITGNRWTVCTVTNVLRNPKYLGRQVWGRNTQYLSGPSKRSPEDQWAVCEDAFSPIISHELFQRAQARFAHFTHNLSDEQILERLKPLLKQYGRLTSRIIEKSRSCPGLTTYCSRFGGLLNVYRRLGYDTRDVSIQVTKRQRGLLIRSTLITNLLEAFPRQLQEVRTSRRHRALLRYRKTGLLIAVVLAYCDPEATGGPCWRIEAPKTERKRTAIVAFLDQPNNAIESLRVFKKLRFSRFIIDPRDPTDWLQSGHPLNNMSEFLKVLNGVRAKYES
jgi:DNA invertase Pin-like site-specific DNA recombinase